MTDTAAPAAPAANVNDSSTQIPPPAAVVNPAPAATPTEAAKPAEQTPKAAQPEVPKPEGDDQEPKGRWSQRVSQLTAQKHHLSAQLAAAQQKISELSRPIEAPDPNNYDAHQAHQFRQVLREENRTSAITEVQQLQQQAAVTRAAVFEAKISAAADRIPDIAQAKQSFYAMPFADAACDVIAESDKAPEITHYLARNVDEAGRIAALPPFMQALEIAKLEGRLSSAPAVKRVSQAPNPPPTLGGGAPAAAKAPSDMSMDDFAPWLLGALQKKR